MGNITHIGQADSLASLMVKAAAKSRKGASTSTEVKDTTKGPRVQNPEMDQARTIADKAMQNLDKSVSISIDKATGKVVFEIIDNSTGETVRQIPPEDMLQFIAKFDEIRGLIFNSEV